MRTRVEELPWIARRMVKANHLTKGYYDTPELWLANMDRAQTVARHRELAENISGMEVMSFLASYFCPIRIIS